MEAVATPYKQLRDERIARNRIELAKRLREAGFSDLDFTSALFPISRAGSSINSATIGAKHAATANSRGKTVWSTAAHVRKNTSK